jgi:hypothetical protein
MAQAPERLAHELADVKRRLRAMERGGQLAHSSVNVGGEDFSLSDVLGAGPAALAATADLEVTALELQEAAVEREARLAAAEVDLGTAGERLALAEADLTSAFGRLTTAEGTLAVVPADITAAQNAAISAAATAAQAKADAAKAAAITAAATDASSKAATAEANAKTAAATDAKTKADAAQAAAISAAATTAQLKADGAGQAAIQAAATDATTKADAAKAAALTAAAADAASKAATAEANAKSAAATDAQTKATQAKNDAIAAAALDATTKANAAEANAKAAAATDATTKMNNVGNTKNATFYSTADASSSTPGTRAGDTWRKRDGSGNIVGEWEWSGSAWTSRKLTDAILTGLDVGKLSAGTATIADLVAQKIAGATATFQTVDIKNLFVTAGAVMDSATAQAIYTAKLSAGKILASEVLIGGGLNLIPNGRGEMGDNSGWAGLLTYDTADKPTGLPGSFRSAPSSGTITPPQTYFPVEPSTDYTFEVWLKADKPNSKIFIEMRDQAGAHGTANTAIPGENFSGPGAQPVANLTVPTTWTRYRVRAKTTATANKLRVGNIFFNHTNGTETTATVWIAGMALMRTTDGHLIVDGSIDGRIITGATVRTAATGARVVQDSVGLRAFNAAGAETVRISAADGSFVGTGNFESINSKGAVAMTTSTQTGGGRPGVVLGGDSATVWGPMLFGADPTMTATDGFTPGDAALISGQHRTTAQRSQLVLKQSGEIRLQAMGTAMNGQGFYLDSTGATISAPLTKITGNINVTGIADFGYEYAEFGSAVNVPHNVGWGPGVLTKDVGRSLNHGFVNAGTGDKLVFAKGGMYQIGCVIDTGSGSTSGVATIRFDPSTALVTGGGKQGGAWEIPLATTVFINAGETLKWTFSQGSGVTQTWNTTIRVYRMK